MVCTCAHIMSKLLELWTFQTKEKMVLEADTPKYIGENTAQYKSTCMSLLTYVF
jgi:hypothetical protein